VASLTELGRLCGRVSEKQHVIRAVMTVAARTGELPVLGLRIDPVLQRMARLGKTACNMKLFRDFGMTLKAKIIYRCIQHRGFERRMRLMTYHTQTCRNNRMDILMGKDHFIVATVAQVRKL